MSCRDNKKKPKGKTWFEETQQASETVFELLHGNGNDQVGNLKPLINRLMDLKEKCTK